MLLTLDDDCLRCVCLYLNYFEQAVLAQTCTYLKELVNDLWLHNCKKVVLSSEQCWFFNENQSQFRKLVSAIHNNVKTLELHDIDEDNFQMLGNFVFPKVFHLVVRKKYGGEPENDRDTDIILKSFPQLTKLSLTSGTTGDQLWQLTNLTELDLAHCESLNCANLSKILTTVKLKKLNLICHGVEVIFDDRIKSIFKCESLEELHINDFNLCMFIDELQQLKKLRKLIVDCSDDTTWVLDKMCDLYGTQMETVIFEYVFHTDETHCEAVEKMLNLQRLGLVNDEMTNEQLISIAENLRNSLKEFDYRNARNCNTITEDCESGLLRLIEICEKLETFDMSGSGVGLSFLKKVIERIEQKPKAIQNSLLFRCAETNITRDDVESIYIPTTLEVTFEKDKRDFPGRRCIQFEWRTKHNSL